MSCDIIIAIVETTTPNFNEYEMPFKLLYKDVESKRNLTIQSANIEMGAVKTNRYCIH